ILKGAYSVLATPDGVVVVLPFANPALATAGTGDVLAGCLLGLLGQGLAPFDAAVAAGFLHGAAGELVRGRIGPSGVLASDVARALPEARRVVREALP
ncbi:MAG TPA: NAD(P)H-hydrate dehydratase, partial [Chloroflexota bacterium]|nr:NAD(P)H-hydrate dehydratase [Chloroflexota bacterium]